MATHAFERAHSWISSRYRGQDDAIVAAIGLAALVFLLFSIIRSPYSHSELGDAETPRLDAANAG